MKNDRDSFSNELGFVLAAAGSAVGLGNIWRFPYLAAKDGGGTFLFIYLILALTFGFALLTTEIGVGRKMKLGTIKAYEGLHKNWKFVGVLGCIVPAIIFPYYCAIGGWVLKYLFAFCMGQSSNAAQAKYFTGFITAQYEPIVMMLLFLGVTAYIVKCGVNAGIEKSSKYLMPILFLLVVFIAGYSLTLSNTAADGTVRTGMEGLMIYLIPNFSGMSFSQVLNVILDAMGQLFFSISVAMGIMVTYGSYVRDDSDMIKSVNQIEFFDTAVAMLAGVMILPAVYAFMGVEGLKASGPGLIFISLPKIFVAMGTMGTIIGIMFFALVFFAALTSAVSIMEAVVANIMECFGADRDHAVIIEGVIGLVWGVIVCLGYNLFYFDLRLPNGSVGQILDIMDYFSNNILMPLIGLTTCWLFGWVLTPEVIINEATKNGEIFGRRTLYILMVKYVAPLLLFVLLLQSTGILGKLLK